MSQVQPRYLSYLIRMWQVKGKRGWQWRAYVESPGSGERQAFPSLDHLIAFLRAQTGKWGPEGKEEELGE